MQWWIIGGLSVVSLLATVFILRQRRKRSTLTSIVLLRSRPALITEAQVLAAAKRLFQESAGVINIPVPPGSAPGLQSGIAVLLNGAPVFYVISSDRPYVPEVRADAVHIPDPAARAAFEAHKSWVSVDVVGGEPVGKIRHIILASLAAMAAAFMDEHTTLMYSTWLNRTALPGDLKKAGESGNIDDAFNA